MRPIELSEPAAQESLEYCISEVRRIGEQKKAIEKRVALRARKDRWRERVEVLRRLKDIETVTAFAPVAEAVAFSRSGSARAFSSWRGSCRASPFAGYGR